MVPTSPILVVIWFGALAGGPAVWGRPLASVGMGGLVAAIGLLAASPAGAQGRPSTTNMTCSQAAGTVARAGAIVLGTGGYTYDRFVAHRGFCEVTQVTKRAFRPTRDNPACLIGYTCIEPGRDDFFDQF